MCAKALGREPQNCILSYLVYLFVCFTNTNKLPRVLENALSMAANTQQIQPSYFYFAHCFKRLFITEDLVVIAFFMTIKGCLIEY